MTRIFLIVVLLLLPSPVWAQTPLLGDLQAERTRYGASMTAAQVAEMLNAVAWRHRAEGFGLLRKGSGNSCPLRDTFISCDILIHAPTIQHFDVLIDAEGRAEPTWNLVGPCILGPSSGCEMSRFLSPFDPGGTVTPAPPPAPPPAPVPTLDLSGIYDRLDALRTTQTQFASQLADLAARDVQLSAQVQGVDDRVKAHDENPSWLSTVFSNRYVQIGLATLTTWITTQQATK